MAVSAVAGMAGALGAGAAAIASGVVGVTFWGTVFGVAGAAGFAIGAGLSMVNRALMPKPSLGVGMEGLQQTVKNAVESRKVIYGQMRTGGNIVYMNTSGVDNKYLHLVIAFAAHEIDSYQKIYFNEEVVWDNGVYQDDWGTYASLYMYDGSQTTSDSLLTSTFTLWTTNHVLRDIAYVHARLAYDADKYQNGIPNITAEIKGKSVLDPRTSTTAWSDNPALCLYDYMLDTKYGMGESSSSFSAQSVIDAANLCDETDASFSGKRYTLNGVVDTANKIKDNIEAMTSAMAGHVAFAGGKFYIYGGEYRTPISTVFDETHMVGDIQLQTKQSRRSLYNAVKGVFVSAEDAYIATDYPAQISGTYSTEDGEPIYLDMPLPFTTAHDRAQRLAKIALLRSRQQRVITMPMNMAALEFKAGDVIKVSNDKLGFNEKVFEVIGYDVSVGDQLTVNVQAIETDPGLYDWQTSDEQPYVFTGETMVYDGTPVAPTALQLNSYTNLSADGTHTVYVDAAWTASVDAFIDFYRFKYAVDGQTTSVDTRDTSHRFIATSGSDYTVTVTAFNLLSRESSALSDTITPVADTEAPSLPTSVTATDGVKSIELTWDNPTEADFKHAEIYYTTDTNFTPTDWTAQNNGTDSLAKVDGESYILGGLTAGDQYKFWLRSVDFTGNKSAYTSRAEAVGTAVTVSSTNIDQTVVDGASAGSTALQDSDTDVNLGLTGGSVGGVTITSTSLYQGAGNFNNTDTGFYLDNTGQFSLKDQLSFDGTDLTVAGKVSANDFVVTGTSSGVSANSVKDSGVTASALSASAIEFIDGRILNFIGATTSTSYPAVNLRTDYDSPFGAMNAGTAEYITLGTTPIAATHGVQDVELSASVSLNWQHTGYSGSGNLTITLQRADNSSFSTNLVDIKTATAPISFYYFSGYLYYSEASISAQITAATLTTGQDYYYRLKVVSDVDVQSNSNGDCYIALYEAAGVESTGGDAGTYGSLTVTGNLTVNGTTTTLNTATLDVEDKNITLNYGTGDTSGSADGAGITIQDAVNSTTDASLTWNATNDQWVFSHPVKSSTVTTLTSYDSLPEGVYGSVNTSVGPFANHHVIVSFDNPASTDRANQLFFPDSNEAFYFRNRQGATWHPWHRVWSDLDFSSTDISNWDTAYGWGDHAGLYLGLTAKAADADKLDGLNSTAYLRDDGWNTSPGQDADAQAQMKSDFTYSNNAPYTGELIRFGAGGYSLQLNSQYNGSGNNLAFRTYNNDSAKSWNSWYRIWHDGDFSSTDISNWDTAYTYSQVGHLPLAGGTLTGAITATGNDHKIGGVKISAANVNQNYIAFYGTTGDQNGNYNHSMIGEWIYDSSEKSELLIAKFNDVEGASGSDRIRMLGNNILFNTYTTATTPSANASISDAGALSSATRFIIRQDGKIGAGTATPDGNFHIKTSNYSTLYVDAQRSYGAGTGTSQYARLVLAISEDDGSLSADNRHFFEITTSAAAETSSGDSVTKFNVRNNGNIQTSMTFNKTETYFNKPLYMADGQLLYVGSGGMYHGRSGFYSLNAAGDGYNKFFENNNGSHYFDAIDSYRISNTAVIDSNRNLVNIPSINNGGNTIVIGNNDSTRLKTRHLDGKHYTSNDDDTLYLNYGKDYPVLVGGGSGTGGLNLASGDFQINGTTAIDSSRNAEFASQLIVRGAGNTSKGNIHMGNSGDGSNKWSYLTGAHYNADTESEGVSIIGLLTTAAENRIIVGGAIYEANPATSVEIYSHGAITHETGGSRIGLFNTSGFHLTTGTIKTNNATVLQMYGGGSGTYNQGVLYCNSSNLVLEAPLEIDNSGATKAPIRLTWRGGYSTKGGVEIGDGYTNVNSLRIGAAETIDSTRYNLYLNSSNGGGGKGIFFRDGFSYNCSITAEDHNGNFADGIHIQGYDGVTIGTGSNSKQTKLAIDVNGHATFYNNLTVNGSLTTNNGRVMKSLGGTGDYINYVIPLIQLSGHAGASSESTFIGHITAWRGNALYSPCRIEISCQRIYNSQSYHLTYSRSGTINLEPITFNYGGIKYLGVRLNPSAAMTYGGVNVDGFHTGTRPTIQLIPYYRSNDGYIYNSEINSSIASAGNGGEYRFGGTTRMQGDLSSDGSFYCLGKADFQGDAAIEGGSGWGMFKGYSTNYNHFITSRGIVTGTTAAPTITGGHETTLVEYCNTDSNGFVFKRSDTGTYAEIARITRTGITSQGDVTAYSDAKLKDNVATVENALDKVMQLRGVTYTRNDLDDREKLHLGVIAQEVEKVLPEVVNYNEATDVKTVSYGNIVGVLIEAIKEQQTEIDELKSLVKQLLEK